MRKVNVMRMRKYSAKNARDVLVLEVDQKEVLRDGRRSAGEIFESLMDGWKQKMLIKHGKDVHIEVYTMYDPVMMKNILHAEVVHD